jgi:hypothetical protein
LCCRPSSRFVSQRHRRQAKSIDLAPAAARLPGYILSPSGTCALARRGYAFGSFSGHLRGPELLPVGGGLSFWIGKAYPGSQNDHEQDENMQVDVAAALWEPRDVIELADPVRCAARNPRVLIQSRQLDL